MIHVIEITWYTATVLANVMWVTEWPDAVFRELFPIGVIREARDMWTRWHYEFGRK